jgi:hypothetical protein
VLMLELNYLSILGVISEMNLSEGEEERNSLPGERCFCANSKNKSGQKNTHHLRMMMMLGRSRREKCSATSSLQKSLIFSSKLSFTPGNSIHHNSNPSDPPVLCLSQRQVIAAREGEGTSYEYLACM